MVATTARIIKARAVLKPSSSLLALTRPTIVRIKAIRDTTAPPILNTSVPAPKPRVAPAFSLAAFASVTRPITAAAASATAAMIWRISAVKSFFTPFSAFGNFIFSFLLLK